MRFNSATLSSATAVYLDASNDASTDISSFLNTIGTSTSTIKGHFRMSKKFDDSAFALFTISSVTNNTGWFTVSASYVSGNGTFTNSDDIVITFARTGDKGDTGAQGTTGTQGTTGSAGSATIYRWTKTAAGGETSLSGNDNNSVALVYTVGQELIFINGVLQVRGTDYVATTGTTITGLTALAASDIVDIWSPNTFNVSNAILSTVATTKGDIFVATANSTVTRLGVGTNSTVLTADSAEATGMKWATVVPAQSVSTTLQTSTAFSVVPIQVQFAGFVGVLSITSDDTANDFAGEVFTSGDLAIVNSTFPVGTSVTISGTISGSPESQSFTITQPATLIPGSFGNNVIRFTNLTTTAPSLYTFTSNVTMVSQVSQAGKYLTTNGTSTSWATVASYSAPTLGSTSIASGATVTTIVGLTLSLIHI